MKNLKTLSTCLACFCALLAAAAQAATTPSGGLHHAARNADAAPPGFAEWTAPSAGAAAASTEFSSADDINGVPLPPNPIFCSGFQLGDSGACPINQTPGAWTTATAGPPERYRAGGTSDSASIYVFGGSDSSAAYLSDLWKWNPALQTWTPLASMPTGKSNIQGSYLNGKIYVPGGYNGKHIGENAIYDISTNTWTTGAPLPVARSGATAAFGGKIYVFGGNPSTIRLDIYDPGSDSWAVGANLPIGTTYGRAVTAGNYIYYVGGITGGSTTTAAVYRYDPATNSFAAMTPLQTARSSEELMADGGKIVAVNGGGATFFTGVPLAQSVEIYNISTNSWSYGLPLTQKAAGSAGGKAGGKLMIMGGVDTATYFNTTQVSTLIPD